MAYGIYLLLSYAPFLAVLFFLCLGCCCSRLLCPRGELRPLALKDSCCTCYGLCDPNEFRLSHSAFQPPSAAAVSALGSGVLRMPLGASARAPRPGDEDDRDTQEEKVGFLL